ncbi:MAG: DNA polymerase III subunit beta [Kiritimatiellae bacterium]|nr:DNA polymerase III subunit beta [Kiritimatiellia bacterium]MDW8457853.1 DNA polymerase III subunit beta [Verrucomicrobiota bacterium]
MKLTVNKQSFITAMEKVFPVVPARATLPILQNVLLKAEGESLSLTTSDIQSTVQTTLPASVARSGATTIPARRLFNILKELPSSEIELDTEDKGDLDITVIRAGASIVKLFGIKQSEFPAPAKVTGVQKFVVSQSLFKTILDSVHYAASVDENRKNLQGVLLGFRSGKIFGVATDGRRLALWEEEFHVDRQQEGEWTIPNDAVRELLALLGEEGDLRILISDTNLVFEGPDFKLISQMLMEKFPNFRQAIPAGSDVRVSVARDELLGALRRASILLSGHEGSVSLSLSDNCLEISTPENEAGEYREKIAVKHSGPSISILLNAEWLMDPLRNLSSDEVFLELSGSYSPCVIKTDKPFLYVLMPMRPTTTATR